MSAVPVDGSTSTRLGRAVRATTDGAEGGAPPHREKHRSSTNWSPRTSSIGWTGDGAGRRASRIILGVIAGGGSSAVLLAAGFAAAITESISMGAVGYIGHRHRNALATRRSERERLAEIDAMPAAERQELPCDIVRHQGALGRVCSSASVDTVYLEPRSVALVGDWRKSGLKMVLIGLGAAAIGFLIGRLVNTAGA